MDADAALASLHLPISTGEEERDRIGAFVHALPDQHIHVLDLPYRLRRRRTGRAPFLCGRTITASSRLLPCGSLR